MNHKLDYRCLAYDLAQQLQKNTLHLIIAPDNQWLNYLHQNLDFFLKNTPTPIYNFPDWETLPYDPYSPHPNLSAIRLKTLASLSTIKQGILLVSAHTLNQRLCPQTHLDKYGIHLKTGDEIAQQQLSQRLIEAGYQNTPILNNKGEYAQRGAILDIYPLNASHPIRIEWFDKQIDSIRSFDADTHETLNKHQSISILPSREIDLSEQGRICFRQQARLIFGEKIEKTGLYQSLRKQQTPQGLEYHLPLFFDDSATLFDYLPNHTRQLSCESLAEKLKRQQKQQQERYQRLNPIREQSLLPPENLYLSPEQTLEKLNKIPKIPYQKLSQALELKGDEKQRKEQLLSALKEPHSALHLNSQGLLEHWKNQHPDWQQKNHYEKNPSQTTLYHSPLRYSLKASSEQHLAEADLHPETPIYRPQNLKQTISQLQEIHIGDPVVHIDYGVGRYLGLETIDDDELIAIEYAKGAKLYLAITELDHLNKYTGASLENAPLHELGGKSWQQSQNKIKEKIHDTAAELLNLYAARQKNQNASIPIDREGLKPLEEQFPYELTADQEKAINDVYHDLALPQVMDRIICGDVGFGKTEIAIRAAYAAILSGKQVALLAPTTLLAEQHYNNFADRFADTPINIDHLSRFKSAKEQKISLERLKQGQTDLIIGTHRLLQKDVQIQNLGLLIIDEEQRFGVKHKEKLKSLRENLNLLTLTATPIPRTLNLALNGLREISIIATPPLGRQNIHTLISQWDETTLEDAFRREINRGGQIYFLHNDIDTIERIERQLKKLFPELKTAIAHGKMKDKELEAVMQNFYNHHYDLLIATTIIESGIDIPNANTIIINHADKLGLSQLHQLRGRVGRSHQQAYAYLIAPPLHSLNKDAARRLEAFIALDSLGAGFMLASQDLEIRGAGEILGKEQSGQIHEIGVNHYLELLERATHALKTGATNLEDPEDPIELDRPCLLPKEYIYDPQTRLNYYQRLAKMQDEQDIDALEIELINHFGSLPEAGKTLLLRQKLKNLAQKIKIEKLHIKKDNIHIKFHPQANIDPERYQKTLQQQPTTYQLKGPIALNIKQDPEKHPIHQTLEFLNQVKSI